MKNEGCGTAANWNCIAVSVVVVAICTLLVIYKPEINNFDWDVLKSIQKFLSPYPKYIPWFFSEFGREYNMLWPQIAAFSALLSTRKYIKAFLLVFMTQAAYHLTDLIKGLVCRERPCGDAYPDYSFPSCHSSTTMCFLGICIYLVLHYVGNRFWRYFLTTLFALYIFMVGISRIWLSHHFPIDVIAGMFLGFMLVNIYILLCKFFDRRG